jgi:chromosomal replication initiation ATPase DnaA
MPQAPQLLLPFSDEPEYAESDFIHAESNAAARAWIARPHEWPDRRLAVWGEEGCGKTHMMHIWAGRVGASVHAGASLRGLPERLPEGGIGIDDIDGVRDEVVLFHWLNAARDAGVPVMIASRVAAARLPVRLPDLASRLRAFTAVGIDPPEDDLLRGLLAHLLSDRQWRLDLDVQQRILPLLPRQPARLREVVARLDRTQLAAGGRVTLGLVKAVLQEMPPEDG